MTNENKVPFLQRFNKGENFNTIKSNAIKRAQNLKAERVLKEKELLEEQEKKRNRNEQQRLLSKILNNTKYMTNENKVPFLQRFNKGENFNTIKSNAIKRAQNLKAERVQKEKKRIRNEQQRLLSKILNNSKNMTNENKVPFLQRFNKGENFNTVKGNAIRKAQNLKRNRIQKEKNELNRKAKEEENRLAKEKANQNAKNEANREGRESKRLFNEAQEKKEANRLAKEEANKIQREKNREEKR